MKILHILEKILPKIIIIIPILYFIISYFIIKVIPGEDVIEKTREFRGEVYNFNFILMEASFIMSIVWILINIFNKKLKIIKTYLYGLGLFFVSSVMVAASYEFTFHSSLYYLWGGG